MAEKYIVFKKEEWDEWTSVEDGPPMPSPIEDACVLRRQDMFCAAGMRGYAAGLMTVSETLDFIGWPSVVTKDSLQDKIEWAMDQADKSEAERDKKIPD